MNTNTSTKTPVRNQRRSYAPYWLAVLPATAVIASFITLYFVIRYPDQAIPIEPVTEVHDIDGTHQHVINSVTPPLR